MKKGTFKHSSFNTKTALHQQKIRKMATVVGLVGAASFLSTSAFIDAKHELANRQPDQANVVAPAADQTTDKIEQEKLVAALREIVSKMDLTAEEIDQLCHDYGFPAEIFVQPATTQNEAELAR